MATLVRGVDDYHNFDLVDRPATDFDGWRWPARLEPILFGGAERPSAS